MSGSGRQSGCGFQCESLCSGGSTPFLGLRPGKPIIACLRKWPSAMSFRELLERPQFSIPQTEKERLLLEELVVLTGHHRENCREFSRIVDVFGRGDGEIGSRLTSIPFLPVSLFKTHRLSSISAKD